MSTSDKDRRGRPGTLLSRGSRFGVVTLVLAVLTTSAPLLAQVSDSASLVVLFEATVERATPPVASRPGSRSADSIINEMRRARPLPDLTLGRMVAAGVAAAIEGLPSYTAIVWEGLIDSSPWTRGLSEERRANPNCIMAQQLALINDLDFVLCGQIEPLSEGDFHVQVAMRAMDAGEWDRLVGATVDDLAQATQHAVGQFQEWMRRRQP